ncbi:MAG: hypothetical protein QOE63_186 [Acidimicrobiaceae bacterium]
MPVQLLTYTNATPSCASRADTNGTVTLTWTTKGATEVWIQETPVAVGASDPKSTPGSKGPLTPNGTTSMPFDCSSDYDYYNLAAYGPVGTPAGEVKQVANPVPAVVPN